MPLLVWWLASAAAGAAAYGDFTALFTTGAGRLNVVGWVIGVGLTLAFFQHMLSGVRHFFMDAGALFELKLNRLAAVLTIVGSVGLTGLFWAVVAGLLK